MAFSKKAINTIQSMSKFEKAATFLTKLRKLWLLNLMVYFGTALFIQTI